MQDGTLSSSSTASVRRCLRREVDIFLCFGATSITLETGTDDETSSSAAELQNTEITGGCVQNLQYPTATL